MTNKNRASKILLLPVVIGAISAFSFLPEDAFADRFCSKDYSICIRGHVENSNINAVVGKAFSVTYIVDYIDGTGFINFNFHGLQTGDGQYYLVNHNNPSRSYHIVSTGQYISPVSSTFMATKAGQYTIELDISAGKNSASDIASKQYFTVTTPQADTVPEFPAALPLLVLSISLMIAFYRIKILK